jgi:hypothetical protein
VTASRTDGRAPLGIAIGAFLCAAWSAVTALVLPLAAAGALPLSIGGEIVPTHRWMRVAAPALAASGLVLGSFAIGVAAGRPWTRPLGIVLGVGVALYAAAVGFAGAVPAAVAIRGSIEGLAIGVLSLGYFYFTPGVAAYYRALNKGARL